MQEQTVQEFMARAHENFAAAEALYQLGLFNASASRAYYAAFQMAIAAIAAKGLRVSTDHKTVQSVFNGEVIRRSSHIPSEFKRYLPDLRSVREDADYELRGVSKSNAAHQLKLAKHFLSSVVQEVTV